jgi:integrase/recombinase XerD
MTNWPFAASRNGRKAISLLGRHLGGKDVREVTTEDVSGWAAGLRVRPSTRRTYLSAVRTYFARLDLLAPPAVDLPRKSWRLMGRVLSKREVASLLDGCDAGRRAGVRDRALLEFLYATGLRASEVRRLRHADVDFAAGTLTVRSGKGGKDRVVPMTTSAVEWIRRYLAIREPHEILFLSRWGRPLSEVVLQQILRRRGVTAHTIRRTMATHLLQGGATPAVVAVMIGHANLETLSRYARLAGLDVKAAHQRFHPRENDHE